VQFAGLLAGASSNMQQEHSGEHVFGHARLPNNTAMMLHATTWPAPAIAKTAASKTEANYDTITCACTHLDVIWAELLPQAERPLQSLQVH
jgi:hypothetical protein